MRSHLSIFCSMFSAVFIVSCSGRTNTDVKNILPQYLVTCDKDTINYLDVNGMKQGRWIIYETVPSLVNTSVNRAAGDSTRDESRSSLSGQVKIEEGFYKNNKKTGYWKKYNDDGSLKDSLEFR